MSDKAKKRRSGRDAKYYQNQFIVTERNKARRKKQRERKANSHAAQKRAGNRKARHDAKYDANLRKRSEKAAAKPAKAQPVQPTTEEAQSHFMD